MIKTFIKRWNIAPSKFNFIDSLILFDSKNLRDFFTVIFKRKYFFNIIIFFVISINNCCIFILNINITFYEFIYKVVFF